MTISIAFLLFIALGHWVADFVCQTHEMAINKSKSNKYLTYHVVVYTLVMTAFAGALVLSGSTPSLIALFIWVSFNGVTHWVTDYFTSRWSSKYFSVQDYHNGFVVVGLDQFIHLTCLTMSTALLIN